VLSLALYTSVGAEAQQALGAKCALTVLRMSPGAPHPSCPECAGYGQGRAVLKDTRYLSPSALALYAGIKQTKEGVQVLTHSKLDAMEKLLKHLGGYNADHEGRASSFAEALAGFVAQIHSAGGSRLPIRPPATKA
jgi:phage terminase small subunit